MRQPRLYGLYRVIPCNGTRKHYLREYPNLAYPKPQAVRIFQSALLAGMFEGKIRELRPVRQGMLAQ